MDFLQEEGYSSKVLDVNEDHIADYTDYLQEGDGDKTLKPTFFNHYLRETRAFMYWCQDRYIVQFCIQALFHELRDASLNRFWMSSMLPMFVSFSSSRISALRFFSSGIRFFLTMVLPLHRFYSTLLWSLHNFQDTLLYVERHIQ